MWLMCLWLMYKNIISVGAPFQPWGLGMGGDRACSGIVSTHSYEHRLTLLMWVSLFTSSVSIFPFKTFILVFSEALTHTQKCYCWSGRSVECCVAKRRAEQYSTGDCINTQALCCSRRGLFPSPLVTHSLSLTFTLCADTRTNVLENTLTLWKPKL